MYFSLQHSFEEFWHDYSKITISEFSQDGLSSNNSDSLSLIEKESSNMEQWLTGDMAFMGDIRLPLLGSSVCSWPVLTSLDGDHKLNWGKLASCIPIILARRSREPQVMFLCAPGNELLRISNAHCDRSQRSLTCFRMSWQFLSADLLNESTRGWDCWSPRENTMPASKNAGKTSWGTLPTIECIKRLKAVEEIDCAAGMTEFGKPKLSLFVQ